MSAALDCRPEALWNSGSHHTLCGGYGMCPCIGVVVFGVRRAFDPTTSSIVPNIRTACVVLRNVFRMSVSCTSVSARTQYGVVTSTREGCHYELGTKDVFKNEGVYTTMKELVGVGFSSSLEPDACCRSRKGPPALFLRLRYSQWLRRKRDILITNKPGALASPPRRRRAIHGLKNCRKRRRLFFKKRNDAMVEYIPRWRSPTSANHLREKVLRYTYS